MTSRPEVLTGTTYKIKTLIGDEFKNVYVTVTGENGKLTELFINSKDPSLHQHITILGDLATAQFKATDDPLEVVKLMESIFDAEGFYYDAGVKYNSLVAHIGSVIKNHLDKSKEAVT